MGSKKIVVKYESEEYEWEYKPEDTIQQFREGLLNQFFRKKGATKIDQVRVVMVNNPTGDTNRYVLFEPTKKMSEYSKDFGEMKDDAFVEVDLRSEWYVRVKRQKKTYFIYVDAETTVLDLKRAVIELVDKPSTLDIQLKFEDGTIISDDSKTIAELTPKVEFGTILKLDFKASGTETFEDLPLEMPKYTPPDEKILLAPELKQRILDMRGTPASKKKSSS